ncbi:MAG: hypothetical protein WC528_05430 [Patescibacteria group bacterium]
MQLEVVIIMRMPWKYHRPDKREEWHKQRTEYIQAKKRVMETERQELGEDVLVWQTAAVMAVLYHLGLLPKGKQK